MAPRLVKVACQGKIEYLRLGKSSVCPVQNVGGPGEAFVEIWPLCTPKAGRQEQQLNHSNESSETSHKTPSARMRRKLDRR